MHVVVLVKQVPDTWSERRLRGDDWILDRDGADAVIDEIDTRGVEAALSLVETHGGDVTVVTMGPPVAHDALRKALAMGATQATHIVDDGLEGSCAVQTSAVLAAAITGIDPDVVIVGNESTDGSVGAMGAMLAERLGWPQVTSVRGISVQGSTVTGERINESGRATVTAELPAVVSVTEKANEPRYPNFKSIIAAKKKPVTTLSLNDLGLDSTRVGLAAATTRVVDAQPRPPRAAGQKITDDGTGAWQVLEFLAAARLA